MNILKIEGPFSEVAGFALGFVPTAIVIIIIIMVYKRRQILNKGTCFCLKLKAYLPNNDVYENNSEVAHTIELPTYENTGVHAPTAQYEALNFDGPKENVYLDANQEPELPTYENTGVHARPTDQYEALNFDDPKENVYLNVNQKPDGEPQRNAQMNVYVNLRVDGNKI